MSDLIKNCRGETPETASGGAGAASRYGRVLTTLFLVLAGIASLGAHPAAVVDTTATLDGSSAGGLGTAVVRLCGALAVVLALFLGGVWVVRRRPWSLTRPARVPDLRVVECRSLGGRQTLWVVAYRQQRILIGSSPTGLSLLAHLPEAGADEPVAAPASEFASAFHTLLQRRS